MIFDLNNISEIELVMCTQHEFSTLATHVGSPSYSNSLVMSNGVKIGYRSNKHVYISPHAFKVATGKWPKGYRQSDKG